MERYLINIDCISQSPSPARGEGTGTQPLIPNPLTLPSLPLASLTAHLIADDWEGGSYVESAF